MSDRLAELQRQRALMQEHLAWLDREIAAEQSKSGQTSAPSTTTALPAASLPQVSPTPVAAAPLAQPATPDADALLQKYTSSPESIQSDVRKGCFLYVALAAIALIALVAVLYFALSRK